MTASWFPQCLFLITFLSFLLSFPKLFGNIWLSMASLVIFMQLRYLFHEVQRRIRRHKNYLRVVGNMEARWASYLLWGTGFYLGWRIPVKKSGFSCVALKHDDMLWSGEIVFQIQLLNLHTLGICRSELYKSSMSGNKYYWSQVNSPVQYFFSSPLSTALSGRGGASSAELCLVQLSHIDFGWDRNKCF